MRRGGWIILIFLSLALGAAFLTMIWIGMRKAAQHPVQTRLEPVTPAI